MKNFYDILSVSKSASSKEIKDAYRKLAMKWHPDKNPDNKAAEEKFKQISEAYETLKDPEKKRMYDQFGSTGPNPFSGGAGFGGAGAAGAGGFRGGDPFNDLGDIFGDIFNQQRGGASRGRGGRRASKGNDLRYMLTITFEEAAVGCEKTIFFMRVRGNNKSQAKISVKVPPGVKSKQRLKLSGEGDKSQFDGAAGDLFVIINFQKHILFERIEDDVQMELPISFAEAIIGTTVKVPTLTGAVSLQIPAGSHANQIFRLRKKGFPNVNKKGTGDMLVKLLIDVPTSLSEKQIQIIRELDKSIGDYPLINKYKEKILKLK